MMNFILNIPRDAAVPAPGMHDAAPEATSSAASPGLPSNSLQMAKPAPTTSPTPGIAWKLSKIAN